MVMCRCVLLLLFVVWCECVECLVWEYVKLFVDLLGLIFGFFDGYGWNMVFDSEVGWLNGVYDFVDVGIGLLY